MATWRLLTAAHAPCFACAVSLAPSRMFTSVRVWRVVCAMSVAIGACSPRLRCPWPLGASSLVPARGPFCVRCPWPPRACPLVCALGLFCVPCPWRLGACSLVCAPACCVCGVLGHLAVVHQCSRPVLCVCGVLDPFALGHRCAAAGVLCVRSSWPLCTPDVLCVQCLWPLGAFSPGSAPICIVGGLLPLVHWCPCPVWCSCAPQAYWPLFLRNVCVSWCTEAFCVLLCPLWFLRAPSLLACRTLFWGGVCLLTWSWLLGNRCLALVVASGVHFLCASWLCLRAPCFGRSGCSWCAGQLSSRRGPFPYQGLAPLEQLGCCAGHVEGGQEQGSWCLALDPAAGGALGPLCVVQVRVPLTYGTQHGTTPKFTPQQCNGHHMCATMQR